MKVRIKPFLTMKEIMGGQSSIELEIEGGTIMSLLIGLGKQFGESFTKQVFDSEMKELSGNVLVLVNGRNHTNLPQGLHTAIQDGDELAIFPPMAGGNSLRE